jgi:O-antigen ligase
MSLTIQQTAAFSSGPSSNLDPSKVLLDTRSKTGLIRLTLVSLFFVIGCVFVKVPFTALIVFAYIVFIKVRYRLETPDLLAVWLVAAPFLGPYTAVHIANGIPDINFGRLFAILLLMSAFSAREGGRIRLFTNGLDYSLLLFVAACLISIFGSFMIRTPLRLFIDALLIPCGYYFVAKKCATRSDFLPKLFLGSVLAVLALSSLGVYETFTDRDVLQWYDVPEDTEEFRINGPFGQASEFGLVLIMLLLFIWRMQSLREGNLLRRWRVAGAILLGVVAVFGTKTRGIWLALAAGWLLLHFRRRPFRCVGALGLAVIVWLVLEQAILPQVFGQFWQNRIAQKKTVYARIATYQSALAMFEDHPVLGIGFGNFSEAWERYPERYFFQYEGMDSVSQPHNIFLSVLCEMGLVGGIAFITFQIQILRKGLQITRTSRDKLRANYGEVATAIGLAFIVGGLGMNFTYNVGYLTKIYFLFLGIISGTLDSPEPAPARIPEAL